MKFEDFFKGRSAGPEYGAAPAHLIERHRQLTARMTELYEAGVSLSSPTMLELSRQINELNRQISTFYPEEQDKPDLPSQTC